MVRYVILAINSFDYILSKTGNMLIRYQNKRVVSIVDPKNSGKTAQDILGWGGQIPCLNNVIQTLKYDPTHLVIGNAPPGGLLDRRSRKEILIAIENGINIISGMHSFLNDDDEISNLANKNNIKLMDLRRPPNPPHFSNQLWKNRKFPVLLVVGTDCDTGKMTTAWEITKSLRNKGKKVEFLGTGQTGILLSGNGVPVDAVIADFIPGEIEYCINNFSKNTELVVVEGQGAINNVLYSGVSLGLLHGTMPDFLILTHEPGRKKDVANNAIPNLEKLINLHLDLLKPFKSSKFLGVNLLTLKMNNVKANKYIKDVSKKLNLPTTDLVRFDDNALINNILIKVFN